MYNGNVDELQVYLQLVDNEFSKYYLNDYNFIIKNTNCLDISLLNCKKKIELKNINRSNIKKTKLDCLNIN